MYLDNARSDLKCAVDFVLIIMTGHCDSLMLYCIPGPAQIKSRGRDRDAEGRGTGLSTSVPGTL